jgi:ribosome-associated heat shock protein Hsp15
MAADACNGGKVRLNGDRVKAARMLKPDDEVEFKSGPITRRFKVLGFPKNRIPAKEVSLYLSDITPETEIIKLETLRYVSVVKRDPGAGRPTKKERRAIDDFLIDEDSESV